MENKSLEQKDNREKNYEIKREGGSIFFTEREAELFKNLGREFGENVLRISVLLYIIDKEKTKTNYYGESKEKIIKKVVELYGLPKVITEEDTFYTDQGVIKRGIGKLEFKVYIEQLVEKGLIIFKDEHNFVFDFTIGDYIKYRGQVFEITNDGYSQLSNKNFYIGNERYYITISAVEVDEDF